MTHATNGPQHTEDKLDARIEKLVKAMNDVDAVHTFSSCGGHPDPKGSQASEGEFVVDFVIDNDEGSLATLGLLTCVTQNVMFSNDGSYIIITPWFDGGLAFELRGSGVDPDTLAQAITDELALIEFECCAPEELN